MTSTDTLLPCECGGKPRREHFPSINGDLWLCENSTVYSGTCRSRGSLSADFWNADRTPPTPATDEREAVARAICLAHGAFPERRILAFYAHADAALSALREIRAAEILAAEANERARWVDWLATGANVWRETADNATGEPPKFFHAQGAEYAMLKVMDAMRRNEHGSGK